MFKKKLFLELLIVLIITIPSFVSLLHPGYFSHHDDQHIARLFLFDLGLKQGTLYPRWVGFLGFGFGFPLFNFYPPLIYIIAELFHFAGVSLIWSIKLMLILGLVSAAWGMYLFVKNLIGKLPALISSVLYTYFFYHAVVLYIRGAFAEFFTMSILPFLFLALFKLSKKPGLKTSIILGILFALLILAHPLIALPSVFYLGVTFVFLIFFNKDKTGFLKYSVIAFLIGLGLSSFYWYPSLAERKFTTVDQISIKELFNYKIHYIYPSQFWYSPWGFGGSIAGPNDGMTFQLGKVHISFLVLSVILAIIYFAKKKKDTEKTSLYYFFLLFLFFSLFMATPFSSPVWNNIKYLWYLQFPWRFLTFVGLFISILGGFGIYFLEKIFVWKKLLSVIVIVLALVTVIKYSQYFKPQYYLAKTDLQLTTFNEIAWNVSRTLLDFIPKGIKTTKSNLGTTIPAIKRKDLPRKSYQIIPNEASVKVLENKFEEKSFLVTAYRNTQFQLNTFNFPGWTAYVDKEKVQINDNNDFKLITINIPMGQHQILFRFEDTDVRKVGNVVSIVSFAFILMILVLYIH